MMKVLLLSSLIFLQLGSLLSSRVNEIASCCVPLDSEGIHDYRQRKDILKCVNNEIADRRLEQTEDEKTPNSKIGFITYHPTSSTNYYPYTLFLNEYFASFHGHPFLVVDQERSDFDMHDNRWDKIRILSAALHPSSGWGKDLDYVVWVDSDVVFLNASISISEVVANHPNAHVIGSENVDKRQGVMNSAVLILKNSKFTRQFLDRWWGYEDEDMETHDYFHSSMVQKYILTEGDQNQLDALVRSYQSGEYEAPPARKSRGKAKSAPAADASVKDKILLLPPGQINSAVPAFLHQLPSDGVLNLRDDVPQLRLSAFRTAYTEVCKGVQQAQKSLDTSKGKGKGKKKSSKSSTESVGEVNATFVDSFLRPQVSLTQHELLLLAVDAYQEDCDSQMQMMETMIEEKRLTAFTAYQVDRYLQRYALALDKLGNVEASSETRLKNFELMRSYLESLREDNAARMKKNKGVGLRDWPSLLSKTIEIGSRVVGLAKAVAADRRREIADQCKKYVRELEPIVHESFKESLRATHIQMQVYLGELEMETANYRTAQMAFENALAICNEQSNPITCFLVPIYWLAESHAAQEAWTKAIGIYDEAISNVIKIQRQKLDGPNEYDAKQIELQGDAEVDNLLVKIVLGRGYSFASMGDTGAGQKDLDAASRLLRESEVKLEAGKSLKKKVKDAIIAAVEKDERKRKEKERAEEEERAESQGGGLDFGDMISDLEQQALAGGRSEDDLEL